MSHSRSAGSRIRLRDILRWWPLLLAAMVAAMSAAWFSHARDVPTFTSTTRVAIVPLPQWDETFLGTDLVRDSGDATRTAPTVATELQSDHYAMVAARYLGGDWTTESVASAVTVTAAGETNVLEVTGRSTDPHTAMRLASGFATAMMADRWQAIATQLDSRIATLTGGSLAAAGDQEGNNPAATEQAERLHTLAVVRAGRSDPTLRIGSTSPAVAESQLSLPVTLILAALGGLLVGALAAAAVEFLRRLSNRPALESPTFAEVPNRAANGRVFAESKRADGKSR